jgi:uncharacterized protein YigE (DUF2233 family)
VLVAALLCLFFCKQSSSPNNFVSYIIDPKKQAIKFFYKDDNNTNFGSIQHLKAWLENKNQHLLFAMNGGMYKQDHSPQGLFIENKKIITPIDTTTGSGNFYLKPNGIFYITTGNTAVVCTTPNFSDNGDIAYATQSGPMLLINGQIHPAFQPSSSNLNIRNGVGILPDGNVVFAMSQKPVSFYDFASYFKKLGCSNALYLDGLVSRAYSPAQNWIQTDGDFGVMIGITDQ